MKKFLWENEYNEDLLMAKDGVSEAMYIKELVEEVRRLSELVKSGKPICPFCSTEMKLSFYSGYYDSFGYWECDCAIDNEIEFRKFTDSKNIYKGKYA